MNSIGRSTQGCREQKTNRHGKVETDWPLAGNHYLNCHTKYWETKSNQSLIEIKHKTYFHSNYISPGKENNHENTCKKKIVMRTHAKNEPEMLLNLHFKLRFNMPIRNQTLLNVIPKNGIYNFIYNILNSISFLFWGKEIYQWSWFI